MDRLSCASYLNLTAGIAARSSNNMVIDSRFRNHAVTSLTMIGNELDTVSEVVEGHSDPPPFVPVLLTAPPHRLALFAQDQIWSIHKP